MGHGATSKKHEGKLSWAQLTPNTVPDPRNGQVVLVVRNKHWVTGNQFREDVADPLHQGMFHAKNHLAIGCEHFDRFCLEERVREFERTVFCPSMAASAE